MEILLIIIAIAISILAVLFTTLRVSELEMEINLLEKSYVKVTTEYSKVLKEIESLRTSVLETETTNQKRIDDAAKSNKKYLYLEMCYLRNAMNLGDTEKIATIYKAVKEDSISDVYPEELLRKGDSIDHDN